MTFEQLGLSAPLLKALQKLGYETPTPIQSQAIPPVLQRHDLLGCAQTGTGKTAAFALPILQLLSDEKRNGSGYKYIRTLVLTPTRELATQIHESFEEYGKHTGLTQEVIFGGVSQHPQTIALRNGTDILIATPGRLLDLMNQGYVYKIEQAARSSNQNVGPVAKCNGLRMLRNTAENYFLCEARMLAILFKAFVDLRGEFSCWR